MTGFLCWYELFRSLKNTEWVLRSRDQSTLHGKTGKEIMDMYKIISLNGSGSGELIIGWSNIILPHLNLQDLCDLFWLTLSHHLLIVLPPKEWLTTLDKKVSSLKRMTHVPDMCKEKITAKYIQEQIRNFSLLQSRCSHMTWSGYQTFAVGNHWFSRKNCCCFHYFKTHVSHAVCVSILLLDNSIGGNYL